MTDTTDLSQDQRDQRAKILKSARIWGGITGGIAGLLMLWILGGQGSALRFGGAGVLGLGIGFLVFRANFNAGAKTARCEKCNAPFSRTRSDRAETLISSALKEERAELPDQSIKVTRWVEDTFDVLDTYSCATCADVTTQSYQSSRRRDEETETLPIAPPKADPSQKGAQGGAPEAAKPETAQTARAKSRKGSSR